MEGWRQMEFRRQCEERKEDEWEEERGMREGGREGKGRNLIAPPVNLRVWVVASVAITGVEVTKTT